MSDIQNIAITGTQTVPQPKPHTTYTVQISTPTRTWTVSRRYNDFLSLHDELKVSTAKEPPAPLPSKHFWSVTRSVYDEKIIRERRVLLETYLRTILTTKDSRWRTAYTFLDFLSYPTTLSSSSNAGVPSTSSASASGVPPPPQVFTPANWLAESSNLQTLLRLTRSALLKRDALAGLSDAAGSRSSGVEAKRLLKELSARADGLDKGLQGLSGSGLGEGERRRREELVEGIKVEKANLARMAEAGVRTATASSTSTGSSFGGSGTAYGGGTGTMPGATQSLFAPAQAPSGRVFGRPKSPVETSETRPLDDRGLLQLQQSKMDNQDQALGELSKVLLRQRKMGEEIGQEIGEQSDMLDDIDHEVGRVGGKMAKAKREMNRLG